MLRAERLPTPRPGDGSRRQVIRYDTPVFKGWSAGTAWGEWGVQDFRDPALRQEMAAASHQMAPPATVPQGLERLAGVWTAPLPDYAPPFLKSPAFGYIMSAMLGSGLIIGVFLLAGWVTRGRTTPLQQAGAN